MTTRAKLQKRNKAIRETAERWQRIVDDPSTFRHSFCSLCEWSEARVEESEDYCSVCPVTKVFGESCMENTACCNCASSFGLYASEWVLTSALLLAHVMGVEL